MKNNPLIRICSTFTRKEMTYFEEFAYSPFFNKHEGIRALVAYLSGIFPDFNEQHCDRYRMFRKLFPGEEHDQQKLALLFTYTLRLAHRFLAEQLFQEEAGLQKVFLLRSLRKRQQYELVEKQLQKVRGKMEKDHGRDGEFYRVQQLLAGEEDRLFSEKGQLTTTRGLEEKQKYLRLYYLSERMRDACEFQVRKNLMKTRAEDPENDPALQQVLSEPEQYAAHPPIVLYHRIYSLLTRPSDGAYQEGIKALNELGGHFTKEELQNIYNYFQNYCIRQINLGNESYLSEIFQLYKDQLAQGLLFYDNYLHEWHYKNIVTVGIRLEEMDWVYRFITDNKPKLHPDIAENAYTFNLASFYYSSGRLDKVLETLHQVEYTDTRYNLGAKALLLRTYFDLEEWEALFSLNKSFRQYLQRHQLLAESRKMGYANLFRLTTRAARLREELEYAGQKKTRNKFEKLKNDFLASGTIFNRNWLSEKMDELEKWLPEEKAQA